jgi:hypothetical protein
MSDGWDLEGIPPRWWPYVFVALERRNPAAYRKLIGAGIAALGLTAPGPRLVNNEIASPEPDPWIEQVSNVMQQGVTMAYLATALDDSRLSGQLHAEALDKIAKATEALRAGSSREVAG